MRYLTPLLLLQAALSFATFVTLVARPAMIPASFGVSIAADAYPVCYFYAASEFALAFLSLSALRIRDLKALKVICANFSAFHAMSAALGAYAVWRGAPMALLGNVAPHATVAVFMAYYTVAKASAPSDRPAQRIAA